MVFALLIYEVFFHQFYSITKNFFRDELKRNRIKIDCSKIAFTTDIKILRLRMMNDNRRS